MKVRFRCTEHPATQVLMLEGAVSLETHGGTNDLSEISLDLASGYCTEDDPHNHHIVAELTVE